MNLKFMTNLVLDSFKSCTLGIHVRLFLVKGAMFGAGIFTLSGCVSPPTADRMSYDQLYFLRQQPVPFILVPGGDRVDLDQIDLNDFEVELNEFPSSEPQPPDAQVCWAYSASQVLLYSGVEDVTPDLLIEQLRRRRGGTSIERGDAGTVIDIMKPLMSSGAFVAIQTPNAAHLANDLLADSPVILALRPEVKGGIGHAVALVGMRFSFYGNGVLPYSVSIYDPLTGDIEYLDADEIFPRISVCVHFRRFRGW